MNKVYQDTFGIKGNCQSAVLATLLELELQDVPNFNDGYDPETMTPQQYGDEFCKRMRAWLQAKGYDSLTFTGMLEVIPEAKGKIMVCGKSPRGYNHVVIYENGELWHDPHPEGGGVVPEYVALIWPLFEG